MRDFRRFFKLLRGRDKAEGCVLLLICCAVGVLDFLTVLAAAKLDFSDFNPIDVKPFMFFFCTATVLRVGFLLLNAHLCAAVSSLASVQFMIGYLQSVATGAESNSSAAANDIIAKSANLANFVINPFFHLVIALVSIFAVLASLLTSFPTFLPTFFAGLIFITILLISLSRVSRKIGSVLRARQEDASMWALDIIKAGELVVQHPNRDMALDRFAKSDLRYKITLSKLAVMGQAPRTAVDVAMGVCLAIFIFAPGAYLASLTTILPSLGVATFRILPYVNSLGQALMTLRGYAPSVLGALLDAQFAISKAQEDITRRGYARVEIDQPETNYEVVGVSCHEEMSPFCLSLGQAETIYLGVPTAIWIPLLLNTLAGFRAPLAGHVRIPEVWTRADIQTTAPDLPIFERSLAFNLTFNELNHVSEELQFTSFYRYKEKARLNSAEMSLSERAAVNICRLIYMQPKLILLNEMWLDLQLEDRSILEVMARDRCVSLIIIANSARVNNDIRSDFLSVEYR